MKIDWRNIFLICRGSAPIAALKHRNSAQKNAQIKDNARINIFLQSYKTDIIVSCISVFDKIFLKLLISRGDKILTNMCQFAIKE